MTPGPRGRDVEGNSDRDGQDPPGMTKVEYIYSQIALELGLDVPETKSDFGAVVLDIHDD